MLSKFFAAAVLGSALIAAPALAQAPKDAPKADAPKAEAPKAEAPKTAATSSQSASAAGLWQGSKLIGLGVYNEKNEKIGSIVQLMVDKQGKIETVVIGVGGFLGMGERDVAVKFSELKWSDEPVRSSSSSGNTMRPAPATNTRPGTTGTGTSSQRGPTTYPDHAILAATKDQLKAMPQFDYNK